MSAEALIEWHRLAPEFERLKMLTVLDITALAIHCEAFARWLEAMEEVRIKGTIVKSPTGYPIQNPYLSIANQAVKEMQKFLTEFGMTPASRQRLAPANNAEPTEEEKKAAKFFG